MTGRNQRPKDTDTMTGVFAKALSRMEKGAAEYGRFNPATDTRDSLSEAQEELLDAIVYLGMQFLKLDETRARIAKLKA